MTGVRYDVVVGWQKPVKDGVADVRALLGKVKPAVLASKLSRAKVAEAQHLTSDAEAILDLVERDGSSGVHAPGYTLSKVKEARLMVEGALELLGVKPPARVSSAP